MMPLPQRPLTQQERVYDAALRVVEALDIDATLIRMPSHVALALANLQSVVKTVRASPQNVLLEQIKFARENFLRDGAEGETVWALADAAERLLSEERFSHTLAKKCDELEAQLKAMRNLSLSVEDED